MGFAKPPRRRDAGGLLHHRFSFSLYGPQHKAATAQVGVFFSAALSVGSPRLAVSQHPALWSPDFPHVRARLGEHESRDRLAHFARSHCSTSNSPAGWNGSHALPILAFERRRRAPPRFRARTVKSRRKHSKTARKTGRRRWKPDARPRRAPCSTVHRPPVVRHR